MATTLNGVYKCKEYDINIAAAFLNGNDASSVESKLTIKEVRERFRIMSRLTEFDIEPNAMNLLKFPMNLLFLQKL
ncbi:MAG TPA: hypothetical protein VFE71_11920 [Bacteroidales bacterium]|nr:hypothetical protein [Bacteroidales bacterium]